MNCNTVDLNRETDIVGRMNIEAVRTAELSREELDFSDEFDAAIYSLWVLMNPLGIEERGSVGTSEHCENVIDCEKSGKLRFTAHAHHDNPVEESPDDAYLYSALERMGSRFIHFIIDRFRIFRIL